VIPLVLLLACAPVVRVPLVSPEDIAQLASREPVLFEGGFAILGQTSLADGPLAASHPAVACKISGGLVLAVPSYADPTEPVEAGSGWCGPTQTGRRYRYRVQPAG
jgi:hypothetical protein